MHDDQTLTLEFLTADDDLGIMPSGSMMRPVFSIAAPQYQIALSGDLRMGVAA
jgi:hypothetical protein